VGGHPGRPGRTHKDRMTDFSEQVVSVTVMTPPAFDLMQHAFDRVESKLDRIISLLETLVVIEAVKPAQ
jgi:hypothetical protein